MNVVAVIGRIETLDKRRLQLYNILHMSNSAIAKTEIMCVLHVTSDSNAG